MSEDGRVMAEEFIEGYAQRSGRAMKELLNQGRVVVPCSCEYEDCEGWALVNEQDYRDDQQFRGLPIEIAYGGS